MADRLEDAPAARRQFLLLFDLSFSSISGLVRAREAAEAFVANKLRPTDLAAVATLSVNQGVRVLLTFTSDHAQVRRAIKTLGVMNADRPPDPLAMVYDMVEMGNALSDIAPGEGTGSRDRQAEGMKEVLMRYQQVDRASYETRIASMIEALGQLGRALSGVQGRKQVILLSSGFDPSILSGNQGEDAMSDSEAVIRGRIWEVRSNTRFGNPKMREDLERAMRGFSTSDAVVHAVDLSGLAAPGELARPGREIKARSAEESLEQITNLGGGRLYKHTNDLEQAMSEVLELSRYYYLLSFEPGKIKGPGKFHKLRVRVAREGAKVSHRSGYFERLPYAERTPLQREFEAAEIIAKGVDRGEIGIRSLSLPYRSPEGALSLPVVLEIDERTLRPAGSTSGVGLEVFGYAFDSLGRVTDSVAIARNLDAARLSSSPDEHGLQVQAVFTLAPGTYDLRFLVRESASGRTGSHWLSVTLPAFDAGSGISLFPPMFMDDPKGWLVLPARSQRTTNSVSPFVVDADPFVPRTRPRIANGQAQRVCLLAFDGGVQWDPGTSFEIKPALLDSDGNVVSVGKFQVLKSLASGGFRRFVLGFTPQGVVPGDYSFRVRLRDPASGRVSEAYQAVSFD
jgi:VWFA-related protein